jgi:hypothetical protein
MAPAVQPLEQEVPDGAINVLSRKSRAAVWPAGETAIWTADQGDVAGAAASRVGTLVAEIPKLLAAGLYLWMEGT